MALAMLVDEGKIKWHDPIKKYIPELEFKDKYVEENITIIDALSHRSGISGLTNINIFTSKDLNVAVKMLALNDQAAGFRAKWDYNNMTFALSGMVVERVSGMQFHQFVSERILEPLGMKNTLMRDEEVKNSKNRAEAHQYYQGQTYQIGYP